MLDKSPKWAGNNTENSEIKTMSAAVEAPVLITKLIGLRPIGESQKAAFNRAAREISKLMRAGSMTATRLEDIYRGEARRIDADEMDALRAAARHPASIEARNDIAELRSRLARIEAALSVQDAQFHGPAIDALRLLDGRRGGVDRTVDHRGE
jgi:hypothetical protein